MPPVSSRFIMPPASAPFIKIRAGQDVTEGMIRCIAATIDLVVKTISIPAIYKTETLKGICLDKSIAFARDSASPAVTLLSSPDYLLYSLSQQNVDRNKIKEISDNLEKENMVLQDPHYKPEPRNAPVGDFQWDANIVRPEAKNVCVRVQLDTGSADSFISESKARKAQLQRLPDSSESFYLTLNGQEIEARDQVWVEWYAINQAVTRWTKCYVMPNLPVDMLIGRTHIVEYNILAINRAKGAFIAKSDASPEQTIKAGIRANQKDEEATIAEQKYYKELKARLKKSPPPPKPKPEGLQARHTTSEVPTLANTSAKLESTSDLPKQSRIPRTTPNDPRKPPAATSPIPPATSTPHQRFLSGFRAHSEELGTRIMDFKFNPFSPKEKEGFSR